MTKFFTKWDHPISFSLDCDEGDCVERAGYIPVKAQVERLRSSGKRLAVHRAEQYDGDDPEGLEIDPSRTMDEFEAHDYFQTADRYLYNKYRNAQNKADMKTDGNTPPDVTMTPPDVKKEVSVDE